MELAALAPYVTSFTQGFGNWNYSIPTNAIGTWLQDDWKLSPKLTLNLGLRYDNDLGIFNPGLTLARASKRRTITTIFYSSPASALPMTLLAPARRSSAEARDSSTPTFR